MFRFRLVLRGLALALALSGMAAGAAPYPDRAVRLVVPFAPGGGTDVVGRVLSQRLGALLGQSFVVDNRPGAGAMIGAEFVAKAPPDGYTLLLGSSAELTISPALYRRDPYDSANSFTPIALLGSSPAILVANPKFPGNDIRDVVAYARANPGKLSFGSGGAGTPPHLAGELLKSVAGIDMVHIPYKGGGPLEAALMGGEVEIGFTTIASTQAQLKSGAVKALGVIAARRTPLVPDAPAAGELGLKDYEVVTWYGLFAPAGTPAPVLEALKGATAQALQDKEVQATLARLGIEAGTVDQGGEVLRSRIRNELATWRRVIKAAGISVE
jgi:tripartite-type tricarboxylate transporter receptor subunit TctC